MLYKELTLMSSLKHNYNNYIVIHIQHGLRGIILNTDYLNVKVTELKYIFAYICCICVGKERSVTS